MFKANNYSTAIVGKWHLGLAIIYDKNSQFPLAVNEYALALTKTNLSVNIMLSPLS